MSASESKQEGNIKDKKLASANLDSKPKAPTHSVAKKISIFLFGALLIMVGAVYLGYFLLPYLSASAQERQTHEQLKNLSENESLPLSRLSVFNEYETFCMVQAYAIGSVDAPEDSFHRIFGTINYSRFHDEILRTYSNQWAPVGFYAVKDNTLSNKIPVWLPLGSYIVPSKNLPGAKHKYFTISACYHSAEICLRKNSRDAYGEQPITINFCDPSKQGALK
jgi:hypothetical protein